MPKKFLKASYNTEDYKSVILTEEQLCSFFFSIEAFAFDTFLGWK